MMTADEVKQLIHDKADLEIKFGDYKLSAWFFGLMAVFMMFMLGLAIGRSYQDAYYGRRICTVCREHEPENPKLYFCSKCSKRLELEREEKKP